MKTTKVFYETFGRHKLFAVYEVEKDGSKIDGEESKPIIKFGARKAQALVDHQEELKQFFEDSQ